MNKAMTNNRWFTVVNTNILKDSKYEVLMHNVLSIKNRFKIDVSKGQTPINAAEKALSKICNRIKKKECNTDIVLRETTQNSAHKLFFYTGKRILLSENKWKKAVFKKDRYGNILKNPQIKYFKYRLEVCPKSYDELKHVNPLSNWKIT